MDADPLPSEYAETLDALKQTVLESRRVAQRRVSNELVLLYWRIGMIVAERQRESAWGSEVVARLASDLREAFPEMKGFSPRNLAYMRALASAWPERTDLQQAAAKLPWGHIMVLLDKTDEPGIRDWYAAMAADHGWSRSVLVVQLKSRAHERLGAAPTNFDTALEQADSELAQQLTKDPYVLDFLDVGSDPTERDVERGLVDRIIDTLRELGTGFAFVGRQVHLDVDGDDFFIDLLFFHTVQLRYVVVELKNGRFRPEHLGQLSFYVAVVDDRMRLAQHADTVGLLLVTDKSDLVVKYALGGQSSPVGVANYALLPPEIQQSLPTEADLTSALSPDGGGTQRRSRRIATSART